MKSKESSKEDDIQAICELRGAGRNAPLALQLKAIDEEYHYLLDQGQSDRADYVQKLYAWKSKQATQVGSYCWKVNIPPPPLYMTCDERSLWLLLQINHLTSCFLKNDS